jgi:nitrite reductase/ring-hydroxylating ferredoxin subunit
MLSFSKLQKLFVIFLIFISFIGCDKYDDGIPNVRVNIHIDLVQLADVGILQAKYWPGGVNGIIIFRTGDREFKAYERTCPYQPEKNCQVVFDEAEIFALCPCCGSEFDLIYGDLRKGPAKWPLKQYRTSVANSFLQIFN